MACPSYSSCDNKDKHPHKVQTDTYSWECDGKASTETSSSLRSHTEYFPGTQGRKWVYTTVDLLYRVLPGGKSGCLGFPVTTAQGGQGIVPGVGLCTCSHISLQGWILFLGPLTALRSSRSFAFRGFAYPSSTALGKRTVLFLMNQQKVGRSLTLPFTAYVISSRAHVVISHHPGKKKGEYNAIIFRERDHIYITFITVFCYNFLFHY